MASAAPSTAFFVGALLAGTLAWIAVDFGSRAVDFGRGKAPARLLRYGSGPERGPWGEHTAPIDWCEANYAVHSHVAEFWNVLSCAAYLVAAAPHARSDEKWLRFFAVLLALTGLASALFHATLWWSGQKLDEFFENAAVIALFHASAVRRPLARTFVHAWAVGALVCLVPVAAAELHLVAALVALLRRGARLAAADARGAPAAMRAMRSGCVCGPAGFAAWLVDKVACETALGAWTQQAHAFWHLGTAAALWSAAEAVRLVRLAHPSDLDEII